MATVRRGYGRNVEVALSDALIARGFERVAAPNGGRIVAPNQHPAPRTFYPECSLRARKTDLLIGLSDGRAVAVEAKDSASVLNSVKRVLNDTAAKARYWDRSEEHTSELQSLMRISYAVFCLKKKKKYDNKDNQ